jgi:GT2 family glycosyltransferase
LLWEPHFFSYNARNLGIQNSKGEVIAFTDSDTIPCSDWIAEGVTALAEFPADLAAGHITVTASEMRPSPPALYELMFAFDQERNAGGGFSATANLFVTRHVFAENGVFDPTAQTGEDFEWTRAAVNRGAALVYAPSAVVEHPARESWSALLAKARRTALPYASTTPPDNGKRLQSRLQFQLGAKASPGKLRPLSPLQRFSARLVRFLILVYKALCLLRIPLAFRRDLKLASARRATQSPGIQRPSVRLDAEG